MDRRLAIRGADRPDSLRGDGLDFVVLDEFACMRPEAWEEVLRPALSDRLGRALFIRTPKGRNHFYYYFEYAKTDADWAAFQFTTALGGLVDASELQNAARSPFLDRLSKLHKFGTGASSASAYRRVWRRQRESKPDVRGGDGLDDYQAILFALETTNQLCGACEQN